MGYCAADNRYETMKFNRIKNSGLLLPAISLGMWHNFGSVNSYDNAKAIALKSFDNGITHFDLANNYGPVPGSAEETIGKLLKEELNGYRDELIISTKAGYGMWAGPYGDGGSRKYLTASLDQSLKRMGLDYVDIFYHHRPDPNTPMEETMETLVNLVKSGKALYIGLSNYNPTQLAEAEAILERLGAKCLIHQHRYSMLERTRKDLNPVLEQYGTGAIAFCPLAQGLLTDRYLHGIPADSRAAGSSVFLNNSAITPEYLDMAGKLNEMAKDRNQTLAQMALAYALKDGKLTSVIIGASRVSQVEENLKALNNLDFTEDEMAQIETILAK